MCKVFNLVSRQAILDECTLHFPELLPRATWCYAAHPLLWHPMGHMVLCCCGTQWVTWCYAAHLLLYVWHPMGHMMLCCSSNAVAPHGSHLLRSMCPLLFALVLQKIVNAIDADDNCVHILYQAWCLDDGTLAGKKSAIVCALSYWASPWHFCKFVQM